MQNGPRDISCRADIDELMIEFYRIAFRDEKIGYFFTDVAKMDLQEHLPVIGDFWEAILFGKRDYAARGRNPMLIHRMLAEKEPLREDHFQRWIELFLGCVDRLFSGSNAECLKRRAVQIEARMRESICRRDHFIPPEMPEAVRSSPE